MEGGEGVGDAGGGGCLMERVSNMYIRLIQLLWHRRRQLQGKKL